MVGGHVEDGEDFEPAAYRELEEETGVRLDPAACGCGARSEFQLLRPGQPLPLHGLDRARPRLTDADIVVGEGRQIVFVRPGRRRRSLDPSESCRALPAAASWPRRRTPTWLR